MLTSSTCPTRPSASSEADLPPGTAVGEYVIERKVGQGGFGVVFQASHPVIGKVVAIKVLSRRFSVESETVERFVDEARAVNTIRHRNIIDIFSFGQLADGRHYYVMEYLEGQPLDVALEQRGRLPLAEALPILRGIARALDAAHAKGIAHRDLKPENVFLGRDDDGAVFPKLLDFGIAKLTRSDEETPKVRTATGVPLGTPRFMSPEQCRGRDVDHRTDLYAFGVLTYLMLTGTFPLDGEDYMSVLLAQMNDEPLPPSRHAPELPPIVDHAIAWLMKKEAAERPPNLMTVIRALDQPGLDSTTEGTTSVPLPTVIGGARTRSKLPAILGGVVLAVVAGLVVFVLARSTEEPAAIAPTGPVATPPSANPGPEKPVMVEPKPAPVASKPIETRPVEPEQVETKPIRPKPRTKPVRPLPQTRSSAHDIEDPFRQ